MNQVQTAKKVTQIAFMRKEKSVTQEVIREKLDLTGYQYGSIVYETGLSFLEEMYPNHLLEIRHRFEASKMFWNWWRSEWASSEQGFMSFGFNDAITPKFYKQWMAAASRSSNTTASFSTLLKIIKDVEI